MATDNYPPGFNPKELEYSLEDLPEEHQQVKEEHQQVKYTLIVECGQDEEQVMKMSCFSEDELDSLVKKSRFSVEEWQNQELKYLIDRFGDEDDLS